jgi:hypothetical protein
VAVANCCTIPLALNDQRSKHVNAHLQQLSAFFFQLLRKIPVAQSKLHIPFDLLGVGAACLLGKEFAPT